MGVLKIKNVKGEKFSCNNIVFNSLFTYLCGNFSVFSCDRAGKSTAGDVKLRLKPNLKLLIITILRNIYRKNYSNYLIPYAKTN